MASSTLTTTQQAIIATTCTAYGNTVVPLSPRSVEKVSISVTAEEARNQGFAHRMFGDTFYVPAVYDFFESEAQGIRLGYLLMERVHGRTFDQIDLSTQEAITLGAAVVHAVTQTQMESSKRLAR
ncbi:hypothetical protein LTR12_017986 [Friedmanniomyces endolithicus]|nr:hypothetical protein LTR12_017986 [Friedmanniomyces endolithicus]